MIRARTTTVELAQARKMRRNLPRTTTRTTRVRIPRIYGKLKGVILLLEWRNWQTHGTQNPAPFIGHVGSTPTSSTTKCVSIITGQRHRCALPGFYSLGRPPRPERIETFPRLRWKLSAGGFANRARVFLPTMNETEGATARLQLGHHLLSCIPGPPLRVHQ